MFEPKRSSQMSGAEGGAGPWPLYFGQRTFMPLAVASPKVRL